MARKQARNTPAMDLMDRVNLQMKADVVSLASDEKYVLHRIPSGILTVDRLLHGGFARGRHSELFGDWMVGKSLVLYSTLAQTQQRGEIAALVDPENVFNAKWFKRLGGYPNDLVMAAPGNANQLGNVMRTMIQAGDFARASVIGIDSVASLLSKEEEVYDLESDADVRTASLARLMSLMLRQVTMQNEDTTFIWTNQWRDKIGRIPGLQSTPGGRALGFYASTRLEMREAEKEVEQITVVFKGKEVERKRAIGRWVNCTTRKEKTGARPENTKSFLLDYDRKVPLVSQELIDLGMEDEIVVRKGDYYEVNDYSQPVRCHGIKRMRTRIEEDDELREFLIACVTERTAELDSEADG